MGVWGFKSNKNRIVSLSGELLCAGHSTNHPDSRPHWDGSSHFGWASTKHCEPSWIMHKENAAVPINCTPRRWCDVTSYQLGVSRWVMLSHGLQAMTKRGRLEVGVQKGTDVITVNQREEHISCKSNKNEFLCTERCDIHGCVYVVFWKWCSDMLHIPFEIHVSLLAPRLVHRNKSGAERLILLWEILVSYKKQGSLDCINIL